MLCHVRSGVSIDCVRIGRVGRFVVSVQVGWDDGLCPGMLGGTLGCIREGRVGRWVVSR